MLDDALRVEDAVTVTETLRRFSDEARRAAGGTDDAYYASTKPPGLPRLADHLQQSAFWSHHLYDNAARGLAKRLAVVGVLVVCVLSGAALLLGALPLIAVQLVIAWVAGFIAIDWLGTLLAWKAAAAEAARTDARLRGEGEPRWENVMAVFGDYNVVVASVPPIPTDIHAREEKKLSDLWEARYESM